jgi:hypothetical protein
MQAPPKQGGSVKAVKNPGSVGRPLFSRKMANRVLTLAALLAIALGLALGQSFVTWLNATLL